MNKHLLSFVSNYKNENPYLKEWLDYHIKAGVDHFYLYNQCGTKESWEIVQPYVEKGIVTVHDWTKIPEKYNRKTYFFQKDKNHMGYMHAARHYRNESQWFLKIDIDEFLVMVDESSSIKDWLNNIDGNLFKAIRIPRIDFGSSGHNSKPEGGVLENYSMRERSISNYKDMANCSFLSNNSFCYSSHRWAYKWFTFKKILDPDSIDGIRINHYYTKSKEEFFKRQNLMRERMNDEAGFKLIEERTNQVEDRSIQRFLPLDD